MNKANLMLCTAVSILATIGVAKPDASPPDSVEGIIVNVHHTNQMEIEMGRLAEERGSTEEVKNFGDKIIRDHKEADKKIVQVAKKESVVLDDSSGTMADKTEMDRLRNMTGKEFDLEFAQEMKKGHMQAISMLMEAETKYEGRKDLKKFIKDTLPVLKEHEKMADQIIAKHEKRE